MTAATAATTNTTALFSNTKNLRKRAEKFLNQDPHQATSNQLILDSRQTPPTNFMKIHPQCFSNPIHERNQQTTTNTQPS